MNTSSKTRFPSFNAEEDADAVDWSGSSHDEGTDRRGTARQDIDFESRVTVAGEPTACHVLDISSGGAAVYSTLPLPEGAEGVLETPNLGKLPFRVVRELIEGFAVTFELPPEERDNITLRLRIAADLKKFL